MGAQDGNCSAALCLHMTNLARRAGRATGTPPPSRLLDRAYDTIVAEGLAFHLAQPALQSLSLRRQAARRRGRPPRRVGHNLLLRLSTRKHDVLRFLANPSVPFTNNLAEQDGRMMKLRQKISSGFRSEDGAKDFAVMRSVLSTARKQGWNMLQTLTGNPAHLITGIRLCHSALRHLACYVCRCRGHDAGRA